jgi:hypothetical protein
VNVRKIVTEAGDFYGPAASTRRVFSMMGGLGSAPRDESGRQLSRPYFFASPSNLPVFRLMKCSLVQAGQTIPSYSFLEISGSPSNWCWTLRLVAGHLKTKWAIRQDMTALRTRP